MPEEDADRAQSVLVQYRLGRARIGLPLSADRHLDHLFVQWLAARHRLALLESAWVTLRIALLSATVATVLGTLAAIALVRFGRFRGRMLFSGMIYAPLVMPEVITGLSLLLLFVASDIDRGFWTITFAHTTLTACFVTVVVQSRLLTFDTSLEEAAAYPGAAPVAQRQRQSP